MPPNVYGVKIDNLNHTITESILKRLFTKYRFHTISIGKNNKHGYVNFLTEECAKQAVNDFNNRTVNGQVLKLTLQPRIDFRRLTDCKYGDVCSKKAECPYRHTDTTSTNCKEWMIKRCNKMNCPFSHPPLSSSETDIVKFPLSEPLVHEEAVPKQIPEFIKKLELNCQCSICLERCIEPKTLPTCRHSFCKDCLNELKDLTFKDNIASVVCPTCRQISVLSFGGTVSKLSSELTLSQNIDLLNEQCPRENLNPTKCTNTSCTKGLPDKACLTCGILMCSKECLLEHFKKCKCDNLLGIQHSFNDESVFPFCEDHDCFSKNYCSTCQKFICVYCKNWQHNGHIVLSIQEYCSKFDEPLNNCAAKAEKTKEICERVKKEITTASTEKLSDLMQHISNAKYEILSKTWLALNAVEKATLNEFSKECNRYQKENTSFLKKYKKIHSDAKKVLSSSPLMKIMKASSVVQRLDNCLEGEVSEDKCFTVKIDASTESFDDELFGLINKRFGTVSLSTDHKDLANIAPDANQITNEQEFQQMVDYESRKQCFHKLVKESGVLKVPAEEKPSKQTRKKTTPKSPKPSDQVELTKRSDSLIDFDESLENLPDGKKTKQRKALGADTRLLINFEHDDNQESFREMVDQLSVCSENTSDLNDFSDSDRKDQGEMSEDSDNSISSEASSRASNDGSSRARRRRRPRRGDRGRGDRGRGRGRGRGESNNDSTNRGNHHRGGRGGRGVRGGGRGSTRGPMSHQHLSGATSMQSFFNPHLYESS